MNPYAAYYVEYGDSLGELSGGGGENEIVDNNFNGVPSLNSNFNNLSMVAQHIAYVSRTKTHFLSFSLN